MILYLEDWKRYPNAIPDYKTTNKSFLKFVKTLQQFGIKNCLFPLALHDQTLSGVDPHSPDLTDDQKRRIAVEWFVNPWYFLREIARIEEAGLETGATVDANRGIIAQWWCLHNNFDIFMMQPRQTGKSVGMDLHHVDNTYMRRYKSKMLLLTKDSKLMVKNVKKIKALRDLLPKYLLSPSRKDKDVEYMINYDALDNTLSFIIGQGDPNAAINAARGHTIEKFHADEGPFIKYVDIMIPAISSAMDTAIAKAKKNGIGYGRCFTTTAGDLSLPHGRYMYNLYVNSYPWSDELYDAPNRQTLERQITTSTGLPNPRLSLTFSHRQLGMSDEELWRRIRSVESKAEDINKDYFLIWGKGGIHSIVDEKTIEAMTRCNRVPDYVQITEIGYAIKWWIDKDNLEKKMKQDHYILGIDTSNQINRDATAFEMINAYTLETVMSLTVKNASIISTARWLASFLVKYPNVTMIIENRSSAQTFIDTVIESLSLEGIDPMRRMWNPIVDDPTLKPAYHTRIRQGHSLGYRIISNELRRYMGFSTNQQTRHLLYSRVISDATSQSRNVMYNQELTNQIAMLKVDANGRIDHAAGQHDDNVIAWLLANWLLRFGKNLSVYGIDPERVLKYIDEDGEMLTDDILAGRSYIDELRDEADYLLKEISTTSHPGVRQRLIHKLNNITDELNSYGIEPTTANELQLFATKEKQKRRFARQ